MSSCDGGVVFLIIFFTAVGVSFINFMIFFFCSKKNRKYRWWFDNTLPNNLHNLPNNLPNTSSAVYNSWVPLPTQTYPVGNPYQVGTSSTYMPPIIQPVTQVKVPVTQVT